MRTRAPHIEFTEAWEPPKPRNNGSDSLVTQLRREFDLTQEAAAEALGVIRSRLALIEVGERPLPMTMPEARAAFEAYTANRERDRALMQQLLGGSP